MKYAVILVLSITLMPAVDYEQPKTEITTGAINKYASEAWCGGVVNKMKIGGIEILVLQMTRTSGVYSSELYVYRSVNTDLWIQISHLPLITMAVRKVEVDGINLVIRECSQSGQDVKTQRISIK